MKFSAYFSSATQGTAGSQIDFDLQGVPRVGDQIDITTDMTPFEAMTFRVTTVAWQSADGIAAYLDLDFIEGEICDPDCRIVTDPAEAYRLWAKQPEGVA